LPTSDRFPTRSFSFTFPICLLINGLFARFAMADPWVNLAGMFIAWLASLPPAHCSTVLSKTRRNEGFWRAHSQPGFSRSLEPGCGAQRKVAQDAVSTRPLAGQQALENTGPLVQPAVLGGGLEHRILATDLIDVGWHLELSLTRRTMSR
jgi:hypothetical protein